MPYVRPGKEFYATATKSVVHDAPVIESNIPGVAVKQQVAAFGTGPAFTAPGVVNPLLVTVAVGEQFVIVSKGVVEVPVTGITSPAVGDAVYITAADNTLSKTASANQKFGRIVETATSQPNRGCRTGYVRIDLDHKATF